MTTSADRGSPFSRGGGVLAAANGAEGWAADWPTHRGNSQRNAVTEERLSLPLSPVWLHLPRFAPEPAWPPPA